MSRHVTRYSSGGGASNISTTVNPIVYQYYRRQTLLSASLFQILAVSDFLTNLFNPLIISYEMVKPELADLGCRATTVEQIRFVTLLRY